MSPHTESEFKLRATRPIEIAEVDAMLCELGARCRLAETRRHLDVYLDDARGTLRAAGIGLRLRRGEQQQLLTCKAPARRRGALFVREELSAAWHVDAPPGRAQQLPEPLRHRIEPFVLDRPLGPVLRLAVRRELRHLAAQGVEQCELAIDLVEAHANGRTATFQEIELEVVDDFDACEQLATALGARLPLAHADRDKPNHAAGLLGLEQPTTGDAVETAHTPIATSLRRRLAAALTAAAVAEVVAREARDPEGVHQMRVATRRLRTLLRGFASLWPQAVVDRLVAQYRETSRRLGAVRDLDVLLASLPADVAELPPALADAGERALVLLRRARDAQHGQLVTWLCRTERLAEASWGEQTLLAATDAPDSVQPTGAAASSRIAAAARDLRRLLRRLPAELPLRELHEVRLAAKRTRHLAEQFADTCGLDARRCLRALSRVQQTVGAVCDHEAAVAWLLAALPASEASSDGRLLAGALGGLATARMRAAMRARRRAAKALARLDRKPIWRRLAGRDRPDATMAD